MAPTFGGDFEANLVVAFVTAKHDTAAVARGLVGLFPRALVIGCTTAGEILDGVRRVDSLVVSALATPSIRWAGRLVRDVRGKPEVEGTVTALCSELGCDREAGDLHEYFAISLIDGLSVRE